MHKDFSDDAWADYTYWIIQDKKTLKKINQLLSDIERNGNDGIGHPEPLKGNLSGYWSGFFTLNLSDSQFYTVPSIELSNFAVNSSYRKHHPEVSEIGKTTFRRKIKVCSFPCSPS